MIAVGRGGREGYTFRVFHASSVNACVCEHFYQREMEIEIWFLQIASLLES